MRLQTLAAFAAFSALALPAQAKKTVRKPEAKPAGLVCPVTGDKIASKEKAAGSSVYQGKTYYFCCKGCKPEFDKDPAKYVKTAKK